MHASQARIDANRRNAGRSTGPKTPEGKEQSRRNGLKHGLSGSGVVVAEVDADEVEARAESLRSSLDPKSPLGQILVRQMAALSVRIERGVRQESANLATRVRHATEEFDQARVALADRIFQGLKEDPRGVVGTLRKSPEGVDRLIMAWRDLRTELDCDRNGSPNWSTPHMTKTMHLLGVTCQDSRATPIHVLSKAVWGNFEGLAAHEGGGLEVADRKAWAGARLLERIDLEIAGLEVHRESFDFEMIELDRRGAPDRALFDPSPEATRARRYESESQRLFFKSLKEFRQAEAEDAARLKAEAEAVSNPASTSEMTGLEDRLASCWEETLPNPRRSAPASRERPVTRARAVEGGSKRPSKVDRGVLAPA